MGSVETVGKLEVDSIGGPTVGVVMNEVALTLMDLVD